MTNMMRLKQLLRLLPALVLLSAACSREPLEPHIAALRGPEGPERNAAAHALVRAGDRSVPLLAPLVKAEDEIPKLLALQVLKKIGTRAAADAAAPAIHDGAFDIRQAAVNVLAYCPLSPARLKDALTASRDGWPPVRLGAVPCFQQFPDSANAVDRLVEMLQDADGNVREQAVQTLLGIGNDRVKQALVPALQNDDDQVRFIVVQAMGNLGVPAAVPALIRIVKEDDNTFIRQKAALALGMMGATEARQAIRDLYAAGTKDEKIAAQQALRMLQP